jgi:hypothetical protein
MGEGADVAEWDVQMSLVHLARSPYPLEIYQDSIRGRVCAAISLPHLISHGCFAYQSRGFQLKLRGPKLGEFG